MIKRLAPLRAVAWGAFVGVACTLATWMGTPSTGSAAHAVGELVGGGIGGGMLFGLAAATRNWWFGL